MDKYTIDITFFDLNGSLKTLEFMSSPESCVKSIS